MTIVLGHKSALEVLRLVGAGFLSLGTRTYSCLPADATANEGELRARFEDRAWLGELSRPVSVLVGQKRDVRKSDSIVCKQWGGAHDGLSGSFAKVAPGVLVSLPGACLLQLARELPEQRLAAVCGELCGGYVCKRNATGFDGPGLRADYQGLVRYLERCEGLHGSKPLRRVLPYVVSGTASPMETAVQLLLCMPTRLGGYGLPMPRANVRLAVPVDLRRMAGRSEVVPDLVWPSARVVVEYDSDQNHVGAERIASDARRRSALLGMGFDVVTITNAQVRSVSEFDQLARLLAGLLGKRLSISRADFARKRDQARFLLLSKGWRG